MAGLKTNKSYTKRLRVTKTGKILRRKPGQDHFNAKKNRNKQLDKKRWIDFNITKKASDRFLPYK